MDFDDSILIEYDNVPVRRLDAKTWEQLIHFYILISKKSVQSTAVTFSGLLARKLLLYLDSGMSGPKKPRTLEAFHTWVTAGADKQNSASAADNQQYGSDTDEENTNPPKPMSNTISPAPAQIENNAAMATDVVTE